jgi:FAD binding domain
MRTQVGIIGSGPAGLLLARLLHLQGIDTVIIESRSRDYVLGRIRAGVIEQGMADLLREAKAGERMDREGLIHKGIAIAFGSRLERLDFPKYTNGKVVMVYGQTEITHDLMKAHIDEAGGTVHYDAPAINVEGCDTDSHESYTSKMVNAANSSAILSQVVMAIMALHVKAFQKIKSKPLKKRIRSAGWEFSLMCRLSCMNSSMPTMHAALRCAVCVPTPAAATMCNVIPEIKWIIGATMLFGMNCAAAFLRLRLIMLQRVPVSK